MRTLSILMLDENDVDPSKSESKKFELKDLTPEALSASKEAYAVILQINGVDWILKDRRTERRVIIYQSHLD